jgi:hypothetical protein
MFYIQYLTSKCSRIYLTIPSYCRSNSDCWPNLRVSFVYSVLLVYLITNMNMMLGLCQRRSWADPVFDSTRTRNGWISRVRVNNREYTSDEPYPSERLAREKAAELAYFICYNFSVNDGMYPGQRAGQAGVVQGLPVAIGTGRGRTSTGRHHQGHRRGNYHSGSVDYTGPNAYAGSTMSRESSPRTSDSDLEHPTTGSRRSSSSSAGSGPPTPVCMCGRGYVMRYSRCGYCLQEIGRY